MNIHSAQFGIPLRRTIIAVALLAGALFLPGCAPDLATSGGAGDDFPNSKTAIGSLIANTMAVTEEWQNLSAVPDSIDQGIFAGDSLLNSVTADTAGGLEKTAAGTQTIDSVIWDYTDTLSGTATYIHLKADWLTTKADTVVVRYDDLAKDPILGNETIIHLHGTVKNQLSGVTTIYDVRDEDSNGYLDTAYIIRITPEVVRTRYNAAFGSWGNRTGIGDGGHIRVSRLELFYMAGTDTTAFFQLSDRDGDGRIFVQGQAVNQILFVHKYKDPLALQPRTPVAGVLVLEGGFASGNMSRLTADRFSAGYLYRDGTRDTIAITGEHRDSLLSGRDTITAALKRSSPDRLLYDSLAIRLVLAPDSAAAGYGLARISMVVSINGAEIKELRFSFVPDAPMLPGQVLKFSPGNFDATIVYPPNAQGTLRGRFSNGIFSLRYTAADGSTQDISYSQDGTVIE
jgi:hypothetical protein